jgi:hypothetical protein
MVLNKGGEMKTDEYRVIASEFKGTSQSGSFIYELTFNRSLEHTGKFKGIEDGLNEYDRKERIQEIKSTLSRLRYLIFKK